MMANLKQQCFLSPRFSLLLILGFCLVDTEGAAPIQLEGEVGGNVTFRCPVPKQKKIEVMYLQKGNIYVNGYYSDRDIPSATWQNTRVDRNTNEVHMYGLNISHSGDYIFYFRDNNTAHMTETVIKLNVTAKFTRPSVTTSCPDETHFKSCTVTCASHGGFPSSNMTWNDFGTKNTKSDISKLVNRSNIPNPRTMLFTSSSTWLVNCSTGEVKFSCSVGNVTSDEQSVCAHKNEEDPSNLYVIIAAACLVVVIIVIVSVWCWKCKKRPMGTAEQAVMHELKPNECEVEIIPLTESKERIAAS